MKPHIKEVSKIEVNYDYYREKFKKIIKSYSNIYCAYHIEIDLLEFDDMLDEMIEVMERADRLA
jgi:hypothetical protein